MNGYGAVPEYDELENYMYRDKIPTIYNRKEMTRKIVISTSYGGFRISDKGFERYLDLKGIKWYKSESTNWMGTAYFSIPIEELNKLCTAEEDDDEYCLNYRDIDRADPILVQVVEELGEEADGTYASLKVVEIPDDVEWQIDEYDGSEWVAEKHRTWH